MGMRLLAAAILCAASLASLSAQRGGQVAPLPPAMKLQTGETPVQGQCLSREELDLNKGLQTMDRPSRGVEAGANADDDLMFDPNYLTGKWNIDGVVPESPLGPAGNVVGVDTVAHKRDCTYESRLQVTGLGAPFTVVSRIVYHRGPKFMVNIEQDSRGFQLLKMGVVGGDSGGYFSHHWEAPEITHKGKRIRLQGTSFFASPDNYRVRMRMSVDDQPFTAYGTLWWRRDGAATPAAAGNEGRRLESLVRLNADATLGIEEKIICADGYRQ